MNGVTYDTGALIAADRNDRRMWALHAGFLALEVSPTVPTPVLAEAWRGGSASGEPGPLPRPVHHRAPDRRTGQGGRRARSAFRPRRHRRCHRRGRSRSPSRRCGDIEPDSHPQDRRCGTRPTHHRDRLTEVRRDACGSRRRPFGGAKRRIGSSLMRFSGRGTRGLRARNPRGTGRCHRGRSLGTSPARSSGCGDGDLRTAPTAPFGRGRRWRSASAG